MKIKHSMIVLAILSLVTSVHAQNSRSGKPKGGSKENGVVYRYVDDAGKTMYTDRVPPGYKGQVDILSAKNGTLKSTIDRELTDEEYQAVIEEENKQKESDKTNKAQLQSDQTLLSQYSSVNEIDEMKKYELDQIKKAIELDLKNIKSVEERKMLIANEINKDARNKSVYKDEINRLNDQYDSINKNLSNNQQMFDKRQKKYDEDKERYLNILKSMSELKK